MNCSVQAHEVCLTQKYLKFTIKQLDKRITSPKMRLNTAPRLCDALRSSEVYNASMKEDAQTLFCNLFVWMRRSRIEEMKNLALTAKRHEKAIFAYWDHRHTERLTSGMGGLTHSK